LSYTSTTHIKALHDPSTPDDECVGQACQVRIHDPDDRVAYRQDGRDEGVFHGAQNEAFILAIQPLWVALWVRRALIDKVLVSLDEVCC
jgi:hypothetical protein